MKTIYSAVMKSRNFINKENLIMTNLCCRNEENPAPLFVVCAEIKFWSTQRHPTPFDASELRQIENSHVISNKWALFPSLAFLRLPFDLKQSQTMSGVGHISSHFIESKWQKCQSILYFLSFFFNPLSFPISPSSSSALSTCLTLRCGTWRPSL